MLKEKAVIVGVVVAREQVDTADSCHTVTMYDYIMYIRNPMQLKHMTQHQDCLRYLHETRCIVLQPHNLVQFLASLDMPFVRMDTAEIAYASAAGSLSPVLSWRT
jgi:hypothetical protein